MSVQKGEDFLSRGSWPPIQNFCNAHLLRTISWGQLLSCKTSISLFVTRRSVFIEVVQVEVSYSYEDILRLQQMSCIFYKCNLCTYEKFVGAEYRRLNEGRVQNESASAHSLVNKAKATLLRSRFTCMYAWSDFCIYTCGLWDWPAQHCYCHLLLCRCNPMRYLAAGDYR